MKLICENCGYRLEAQEPRKQCPYCGEDTLVEEKDANSLLEEIE